MSGFHPSGIDWANPSTFYLGESALVELADVTVKHGSLKLPAHRVVLAQHSAVLRDGFCLLHSHGRTQERTAEDTEELETPFNSFSLQEAAFFLRFAYCPRDLTAANLAKVEDHLPGIARLAHALHAECHLAVIDRFLASKVDSDLKQALRWVPVAEDCQLDATWATGISVLAKSFFSGTKPALEVFADVQAVAEKLSRKSSTAVLGAVVAATAQGTDVWRTQGAAKLPAPELLLSWQGSGMQQASYTWRVENLRQQQGKLVSPAFGGASGDQFELKVFPKGSAETSPGHVSIFLAARTPGVTALFTLEMLNQDDGSTARGTPESERAFSKAAPAWGTPTFLTHADLDAKAARVLVDGAAVFRATVTWMQTRTLPAAE